MTFTPNAEVSKGVFRFQYVDRNVGISRYEGLNFSSTFGMTEMLEVGGRLSANTWTSNLYTSNSGNRDLSASAKVLLNPIIDRKDLPVKVALGLVDFGGAATYYRSNYIVATVDNDKSQINLGYSKASGEKEFNSINALYSFL
jgi:hypothetical protein